MDLTEIYKKIEAIDASNEDKAQLKEQVYLYTQAKEALDDKRYEDCISILELLLKRMPDDINVKVILSVAYDSAGYPIKSIRLLEELCEAEPDDGEYSLALAKAYRHQGWMQKALNQFKITIELIPDNRIAWENLADCSIDTEDTHEAKMNCFGAIHLLKEYGIESIKLNVLAFSFTILEDNDMADRYLTKIINLIKNDKEHDQSYFEGAISDLIYEIDMAECYEFVPHIREMADSLSEISETLTKNIEIVEMNAEIAIIDETFPSVLCNIISVLKKNCDCEKCEREITSLECSILTDHDGYRPELIRLLKEHPKAYSLHNDFFDEVVSGVHREKLLNKKLMKMAADDLEPILIRADESEINPIVETYRRDGRKIGRNELCPCGSGKKHKKCCGA